MYRILRICVLHDEATAQRQKVQFSSAKAVSGTQDKYRFRKKKDNCGSGGGPVLPLMARLLV